jgi:G3E family GTPase
VLTKTDIASADAIAEMRARLAALNPSAPIVEAVMGAVEPALLFEAGGFDIATKTMDVRRWLAEPKGDHHHHAHDDRIRTASFRFDRPLKLARFSDWLGRLVQQHGDRLLRVKGILDIEGQERPVVVHGVQHMYHPPVRLQAWPDADRSSRVVFIAQDLDRTFLEAELRRGGFEPL